MMKWSWYLGIICTFSIVMIISLLLYGLNSVTLKPFISEVEANQEDFIIIKSSLASFIHHSKTPSEGNYPISITFDNFSEEDAEDLGYALVDNDNCEVFLNLKEKWTREKFNLTLYHELGHCFGLEHDDSAAIMEAEYTNPNKELKSLPLFWNNIKKSHRQLLVMNSGWELVDAPVNKIIDWMIPETKDSLKRVTRQQTKAPIKFQHNPNKKIIYQEN